MQEPVCGLKWFDELIRVVQNYYIKYSKIIVNKTFRPPACCIIRVADLIELFTGGLGFCASLVDYLDEKPHNFAVFLFFPYY